MSWTDLRTLLREAPVAWAGIFAIGACLGSFINVVIHRLPRGISLSRPRSSCPHCGRAIAPADNLPVVSYLLLRGRCRSCRGRISPRYPLVELLGGLLVSGVALHADGWSECLAGVIFVLAMLAVVFIDLDLRIIPDEITLPLAVLGLAAAAAGRMPFGQALLGVLIGGGSLLALALGYRALTGRDGLGMGDVKLMAMVGAILGWQGAAATLLIGSLAGSVVGIVLLLSGRAGRLTALPFGTFLAPAAWAAYFFGLPLWRAYLAAVTG